MKKENQSQNQSVGRNVLIVVLILIILATSAFGIFAWARYQSSVQGESTAQVAKWSFKVAGDKTQTEQIAFPISRTDTNTTVAEGAIAPGTYGEIPIEIDVIGTQTDLIYTISGTMGNLPRNMKLYYDSARTQEILVTDMNFSKVGYLSVSDINQTPIQGQTIYWEWPFETGETAEQKTANNQIDTEDMGKTMTMALTVTGKQINGMPTLADFVQPGDYVDYDADSNGTKNFTSSDCLAGTEISDTISTAESFDSNAKSQWRVLSVDKANGTVEIMSVEPTAKTVTLSGGDGFTNSETVLNNVGAIYSQGKGAISNSGRSINIKDIEQYSSYDKATYENRYSSTGYYGGTRTFTEGYFYNETKGNNGEVIGYETTITPVWKTNEVTSITMTQTHFDYDAKSYFSNSNIYNMLFKNNANISSDKAVYWLASRGVNLVGNNCGFRVEYVENGHVGSTAGVYGANGGESGLEYGVIPVVSLQSNIQTLGQNENGVWELKVD